LVGLANALASAGWGWLTELRVDIHAANATLLEHEFFVILNEVKYLRPCAKARSFANAQDDISG